MGTKRTRCTRVLALPIALVFVLAAAGCGGGSESGTKTPTTVERVPSGPTIEAPGVRIQRTHVGPVGTVNDVVAVDGSVVVLGSSQGDQADVVLHSPDGGHTWEQSKSGLPTSGDIAAGVNWMVGPEAPRLFGAGSTVFATRTWARSRDEPTAPRVEQALQISNDGGATWSPLALPVPADHTPIISASGEIDGTIVLGGTLQRDNPDGPPTHVPAQDLDAYDAAVWTSTDNGKTFERVEDAPFAGLPGMQVIRQLVDAGDRLVAIAWDSSLRPSQQCCFPDWGASSWASTNGADWTPLSGLDAGPESGSSPLGAAAPIVRNGDVMVGDILAPRRLASGASEWTAVVHDIEQPEPFEDRFEMYADAIALGDQTYVGTWVLDAACDCEIAGAGRAELGSGATAHGVQLAFDECTDTSVRGQTGVAAPHLLGDAIGALGWCNDQEWLAAAWAGSTDGGSTWKTTRLTDLAPSDSSDLVVPGRPFTATFDVEVGDGVVVAVQGRVKTDEDARDYLDARPGPIVLLLVGASD